MSNISGAAILQNADLVNVEANLRALLSRGVKRGRDGGGYVVISDRTRTATTHSRYASSSLLSSKTKNLVGASVVLQCNYSRLTSDSLSPEAFPPSFHKSVYSIHDGVVANTDSVVHDSTLAKLLYVRATSDGSDVIDKLGGSASFAWVDVRGPNHLFVGSNSKPLYLARTDDAVYFSSSGADLRIILAKHMDNLSMPVYQMPERSILEIDRRYPSSMTAHKLSARIRSTSGRRRAIVLYSGGIDSLVATSMIAKQVDDIHLLYVKYGCVAEREERRALRSAAEFFKCSYSIIDANFIRTSIKGSSLFTDVKRSDTWVPNRNMMFASIAAAMAEANDVDDVVFGTNIEASGLYPDNEPAFLEALSSALSIGSKRNPPVKVYSPIGNMTKTEIVLRACTDQLPVRDAWTCYKSGGPQCGVCSSCTTRRIAFRNNMIKDPAFEYEWNNDFWADCVALDD